MDMAAKLTFLINIAGRSWKMIPYSRPKRSDLYPILESGLEYPGFQRLFMRGFRFRSSLKK